MPGSKSQAFAQGQPKFSWRIERIEANELVNEGRFKATCKNQPEIFAFGDSEQRALLAAQRALDAAVEQGKI